jgi:hypothetical protein
MEEFGGMGEVDLRKELLDWDLRDGEISTPGKAAPHPGEAVAGVHAVGVGEVFFGAARTADEKGAEGVEIQCGQGVQGAFELAA